MNPSQNVIGRPRLLLIVFVVLYAAVAESAVAQEAAPSTASEDTTPARPSVPGAAGDTLLDDAALGIDPFVEAAPEHEPWISSVREHHRPIGTIPIALRWDLFKA